MKRQILFEGNPMNLAGRSIREGRRGPAFRVVSGELKEVTLDAFTGKVKVINTFPSIDTPVCDLQVKEFNRRATSFSPGVVVLGISKDLPFAQKRFCDANSIEHVQVFSDYLYSSFGINYGLLVRELNLLARAVLILDANDVVRYFDTVEELTHQPDYEGALEALQGVLDAPTVGAGDEGPSRCAPCESGTPPLPGERVEQLLAGRRGWRLVDGRKIVREFTFDDFQDAKYFLDLISVIAEEQGHHPTMTLIYNRLRVTLTTHAAGGLTNNDFIMAGIIDEL